MNSILSMSIVTYLLNHVIQLIFISSSIKMNWENSKLTEDQFYISNLKHCGNLQYYWYSGQNILINAEMAPSNNSYTRVLGHLYKQVLGYSQNFSGIFPASINLRVWTQNCVWLIVNEYEKQRLTGLDTALTV